jgi:hypothetical protein
MKKRLLCLLTAAFLPAASLYAAIAPGENYAVVGVGFSGIKAVVVQTVRSDSEGPAKTLKAYPPLDLNAGFWERTASGDIAKAVGTLLQQMQSDFKIPEQHFYVYGTSGLPSAVQDKLAKTIFEKGAKIEFLTVEQEAALQFTGIVPAKRLNQVVVLDIGSGNSKGGYIAQTQPESQFMPFDVDWGTKSWTAAIDKARGDGTFLVAAEALCKDKLIPAIRAEVQQKPGLQNLRRVYLSGGIPWAMVTLLHPYDQSQTWVKTSAADIDNFYEMARTNPSQLLYPDLDKVPADVKTSDLPKLKSAVSKEVARVATVFSEDQLLAGAQILKAFRDEMYFERKDAIFFDREALYALPIGYLLQKLSPDRAKRTASQ